MSNGSIERNAQFQNYMARLKDEYGKLEYDIRQKERFAPFRSADKQLIMLGILKNVLNLNILTQKGHIQEVLCLHDPHYQRNKMSIYWSSRIPKYFSTLKKYFLEGKHIRYAQLNVLQEYLGPKIGFYFAFMSFYTAWLIIPATLGILVTCYALIFDDIDSVVTHFFGILILLWLIFFYIRWKRKASELALNWHTLGGELISKKMYTRDQFYAPESYNIKINKIEKKRRKQGVYLLYLIQIPLGLMIIGVCVTIFTASRIYRTNHPSTQTNVIVGIINGTTVTVADFIYKFLVHIFVELENHKYQDFYEASLAYKRLLFSFIN